MAALAEPGAVLMPEHLSRDIAASRRTMPASERVLDATESSSGSTSRWPPPSSTSNARCCSRRSKQCGGRMEDTAAMLGLSRKGLYLKRQRFGLEPPGSRPNRGRIAQRREGNADADADRRHPDCLPNVEAAQPPELSDVPPAECLRESPLTARLFVDDALDLRRAHDSVRGFVVAAVVTGNFAFPLHFLVAVVGFADAVVFGLVFRRWNRNDRHVLIFVFRQGALPCETVVCEVGVAETMPSGLASSECRPSGRTGPAGRDGPVSVRGVRCFDALAAQVTPGDREDGRVTVSRAHARRGWSVRGGLKRCALSRYHQGLLCCEANRQTQDKGRTTLVSRTRSGDRPTVKLGDVLRDRETQTEATVLSAGRGIGLAKRLEQLSAERLVESDAGVDDGQRGFVAGEGSADRHAASRVCELDGIRGQIRDDLLNAFRVRLQRANGGIELTKETHALSRRAR